MSQADAINQMLYTIGSQLLRSRDTARSFWGLVALDEDAVVRNRLQPYASTTPSSHPAATESPESHPPLPCPTSSPFQPKPRAQSPTPSFEPHVWHRRASTGPLQTEQKGEKNDTTKLKTLLIFQFMKCHMRLLLTYKTHRVCQNILWLKPHPKWTEHVAHILMWS